MSSLFCSVLSNRILKINSRLDLTFDRRNTEIFLIISIKQVLTFHANCLVGDNLHDMSNPIFSGENAKNIFSCRLLNKSRE